MESLGNETDKGLTPALTAKLTNTPEFSLQEQ
jgi:hypothetical protein